MDFAGTRRAPIKQRYERLLSCSMRCSGFGFVDFLAAAAGQPRYYWETRGGSVAMAGAGTAVELMAWGEERYEKIAQYARELFAGAHIPRDGNPAVGPHLFGGFAFRDDFTPDNTWSIYSPAYFVLPHYQLVGSAGQNWLTINTQIPPDESPSALIPDLKAALREKVEGLRAESGALGDERQSALLDVRYPMSRAEWERMIAEATGRIKAGELTKVVLARAAELRFADRVQLLPILRALAAQYADCYRFLFEPRPRFAFYGASPELLASVQGRQLESVALAGSIGRGADEETDRKLSAKLLGSAKDRHEHQIVIDQLREALTPRTRSLAFSRTGLLKLSHIQHLHSAVHAQLKREEGILPLVEALHPTPALGGDPRDRAMALIRALEPIPRGWYGAPVGWINARLEGEFAVAIRSAVAQESRVWIYAGAGIVADSDPEREWDETELKFRPMLDAHSYCAS